MRRLRNPGGWWQEHASSNGGSLSSLSCLATGREEPPLAHCQRFLVEMSAAYPIFPDTSAQQPSDPALQGPHSQAIPCWAESQLQFAQTLLLAKVDFANLGGIFYEEFYSGC